MPHYQAGGIRQSSRGQERMWLRLPLVSARQAAAGGKLRLFSASPNCPLCSDLGRPAGHCLGAPKCAQDRREGSGSQQKGRKNTSSPVVATAELQPIAGCSGLVQKRQRGQNTAAPAPVESAPPIIFDDEQMKMNGHGDGAALTQRQLRVHLKRIDAPVAPTHLKENEADNPPDTEGPAE
ncbi:hypothetical protein KM043_000125 [Ampulex compressa]|nr:hypothetical protein KM043_000125 [Ampulex compressa]